MSGDRKAVRRQRRRVSDEALREACARAVAQGSLRGVARAIGISPPGLKQFLDGSKPRSATLQKIRDWFYSGAVSAWLTPEHMRGTFAEILDGLAGAARAEVGLAVCEIVRGAHERQNTPIPPWVDPIAEQLRASMQRATLRDSRAA